MENVKLSELQLQEFREKGYLVVPNVLSADEVLEAHEGLRQSLLSRSVDPDNLSESAAGLSKLSSTGGSGGVLDIFYDEWKLKLNEHPVIFSIMSDVWRASYCSHNDLFSHIFGDIDPDKGFMYIDRLCYRVPEDISQKFSGGKKRSLQRSLTPHLDCCPHKLYDFGDKPFPKWKPIQCFVALTDTLEKDQGGFECCPGFHQQFNEWVASRLPSAPSDHPPCVGDFTPIRPVEDRGVISQFTHVPCRAGDIVFWDYRLPHANSRYNSSSTPRAVVYLGFLPCVSLNRAYAMEQLRRLASGEPPGDQWHSSVQRNEPIQFPFSALGRRLVGLDEW